MTQSFTLQYWTDDGWFVGRLREFPAVMSQGETLEELQANIRDAYRLMVEDVEAACKLGFSQDHVPRDDRAIPGERVCER
jgi:predicted RNase H-like HicB family nuclease